MVQTISNMQPKKKKEVENITSPTTNVSPTIQKIEPKSPTSVAPILPNVKINKVEKTTETPTQSSQPQILRDQETGKVSGVTLPNGKTFLGNPRDILPLAEKSVAEQQTPTGTIEATTANLMRQRQQEALAFQPQGMQQPTGTTPINYGQAGLAGLEQAIPGALGGVATGAMTGAVSGAVGGPIGILGGAVLGAAAGAIGPLITGIRNNINQQISEGITARGNDIRILTTNMRAAITDANQGGNPAADMELFYQNYNQLRFNYAQVYLDTQNNLAKAAGEDGTIELAKYDSFFNYTFPNLEREMQQAVLNPNPNKILVSESDDL